LPRTPGNGANSKDGVRTPTFDPSEELSEPPADDDLARWEDWAVSGEEPA
jgi:hypothetical protein